MHPVTWMYVVFIVPIGIAALAYLAVRVYIRVRHGKLSHVKTVRSSGGRRFALYHGTQSPGVSVWHVHELGDEGEAPPRIGHARNSMGAIFVFRYTDVLDPHAQGYIDLIRGRHLVFSRGGVFQGLFDIKENELLVHEPDPQAKYAEWADGQGMGGAFNKADYIRWMEEHLHRPIAAILEGEEDQPPTPPRA